MTFAAVPAFGQNVSYATFLSKTGGAEAVKVVAVQDPPGAEQLIYAGNTLATNLPVSRDALQPAYGGGTTKGLAGPFGDAFIVAPRLGFATYFGGGGLEMVTDLVARAAPVKGDTQTPRILVAVLGMTESTDLPVTPNAAQKTHSGARMAHSSKLDCFVHVFALGGGPPLKVFSTYFGGSDNDECRGAAFDSTGSLYIAGTTSSEDLKTTPGSYRPRFERTKNNEPTTQSFVARFDPAGALLWSTYLDAQVGDLDVSPTNDLPYIVGRVRDTLPISMDAFQRVPATTWVATTTRNAVIRVSQDGTRVDRATLFHFHHLDQLKRVVVAEDGDVIVGGRSREIPTTPGAFQRERRLLGSFGVPFIARFDSDLTGLVFSSYLHGKTPIAPPEGRDDLRDLAVAGGVTYALVFTHTSDYPTTVESSRTESTLCVTALGSDGSLIFSDCLWRSEVLTGSSIAVASPLSNEIHFAGSTFKGLQPTAGAFISEATPGPGPDRRNAAGLSITPRYRTGLAIRSNASGGAVNLANIGGLPTIIRELAISGVATITDTCTGRELNPKGTCTVEVSRQPGSGGLTAVLVVSFTDGDTVRTLAHQVDLK
jgi:hypothetical protein